MRKTWNMNASCGVQMDAIPLENVINTRNSVKQVCIYSSIIYIGMCRCSCTSLATPKSKILLHLPGNAQNEEFCQSLGN